MTGEGGIGTGKASFCSVFVFGVACRVCINMLICVVNTPTEFFSLSPPDVGGFGVFLLGREGHLRTVAPGALAAVAGVSTEPYFAGFLLLALPQELRVLGFRVGRGGASLLGR